MKVLNLLTIGLASATTALASRCKPSLSSMASSSAASLSVSAPPSSPSSRSSSVSLSTASAFISSVAASSASSESSASSASTSISTPSTPICVSNVVDNGYFAQGLDSWYPATSGTGSVTAETGCGGYNTCVQLATGTGGSDTALSQVIANARPGYTYTFTFSFRGVGTLSLDSLLTCTINDGGPGLVWTRTGGDIPTLGGYAYFMDVFTAPSSTLLLNCAFSGSGSNTVQATYFNINC